MIFVNTLMIMVLIFIAFLILRPWFAAYYRLKMFFWTKQSYMKEEYPTKRKVNYHKRQLESKIQSGEFLMLVFTRKLLTSLILLFHLAICIAEQALLYHTPYVLWKVQLMSCSTKSVMQALHSMQKKILEKQQNFALVFTLIMLNLVIDHFGYKILVDQKFKCLSTRSKRKCRKSCCCCCRRNKDKRDSKIHQASQNLLVDQ